MACCRRGGPHVGTLSLSPHARHTPHTSPLVPQKEGYVDPVTGASMAPGEVPSAAAAAAAASSGDISGSADGWGGGWEAAGTGGGGGCDCLPLIRLFPDYNLHKTLQSVLLGVRLAEEVWGWTMGYTVHAIRRVAVVTWGVAGWMLWGAETTRVRGC